MPLKDQDLRRINWRYLIIDEGHRLKNHNCLLIKYENHPFFIYKMFVNLYFAEFYKLSVFF